MHTGFRMNLEVHLDALSYFPNNVVSRDAMVTINRSTDNRSIGNRHKSVHIHKSSWPILSWYP